MSEIKGRVAELIFRNEENFYTVAVVENDDEMEQFTIVGSIPSIKCGMSFSFRGKWVTHPTYGEQFSVSECTEILPDSAVGIREFLSSGVIKGIGPKMARSIVDRFGDKTLEIMEKEPQRLLEIDGIGKAKLKAIEEGFRQHREFAEISMFFANYGINANYAMKMYKLYGTETVRYVTENPYRLVTDLRGTGFKRADEIAARLGVERDSEYRISSGIRYYLGKYASEGNTYVPLEKLAEETAAFLEVSISAIKDMTQQLAVEGSVMIKNTDDGMSVYLTQYFEAETKVARRLMELNEAEIKPVRSDIDELIKLSESSAGIKLSENQAQAVKCSAENGVCVITGGPGTGKTTIINTMIDIFEISGLDVAIAAPTGRAAKRISETSGRAAVTIHRLLEYYYSEDTDSMNFGKTFEDPLEYDVVIVDEMSMVDILLMQALTNAIVKGTRLIMVGDADQLPSVGAGNVLHDIIASEAIHTVELKDIFRQAGESMIIVNAHRINSGQYPYCNVKEKDFFMMHRNTELEVMQLICELISKRLPESFGCDRLRDIQVLTPVRKGTLGIYSLNSELQRILNPPSTRRIECEIKGRLFREGDKIMQIKNNYKTEWKNYDTFAEGTGVFNGDIGFIQHIDVEDKKMSILFDDNRFAEYDFEGADEIELAYAMTIHKSQGSEFPYIIMPMTYFPPMLACRNLLYTGVTRGKKGVIMVGMEKMMYAMVDNNRTEQRYSGLSFLLKKFLVLQELQ